MSDFGVCGLKGAFILFIGLLGMGIARGAAPPPEFPYLKITVRDRATGRGVPGIQLTMTNQTTYWTDSAGRVAFYRPELMGKTVWFTVTGYGYTFPIASFNYRGQAFAATANGSRVLNVDRQLAAQRLYRVTGPGIYDESIRGGFAVPNTQDESASPVPAHQSVSKAFYKGKFYWFWDAPRSMASPTGLRQTICATSLPPGAGGLDPDTGVEIAYLRAANGSPRVMTNIAYSGPIQMRNPRVALDPAGAERLIVDYALLDGTSGAVVSRGLAQYDDAMQVFQSLWVFAPGALMDYARGSLGYTTATSGDYFYHGNLVPRFRTTRQLSDITMPQSYEAFTCLKYGSVFDGTADQLDRDNQGNLVWGWRRETSPVGDGEFQTLRQKGLVAADEARCAPTDIETGAAIALDGGSVQWNSSRQRWVAIQTQSKGASARGEVWYFEGDTQLGPWVYGQKIVSYANIVISGEVVDGVPKYDNSSYGFYDPLHHAEFDRSGGQIIYFEGTLSRSEGTSRHAMPQYNDNQMMYKLDLADSRLYLPVPVYRTAALPSQYRTKTSLTSAPAQGDAIVCFAPDRARSGLVPIYEYYDASKNTRILTTNGGLGAPYQSRVSAFYAYSASASIPSSVSLGLVALNEYIHSLTGDRLYTTGSWPGKVGYVLQPQPVCIVWKYPLRFDPYSVREILSPFPTPTPTPRQTGAEGWNLYGDENAPYREREIRRGGGR